MNAALATAACIAATAVLVAAEYRQAGRLRAAAKTVASLCFVGVALLLGAPASTYGSLVLLALVLGAIGDVLLLSARAFLAGLGAFLAAHVCFSLAFLHGGVAWPAVAAGVALALPFGWVILRWLWPHLAGAFRIAVTAYLVVILLMCALAAGHATAQAAWAILLAALLFAASDIAVARDKFVAAAFINRAWGLPTYYAAQLMLAWSVRPAG